MSASQNDKLSPASRVTQSILALLAKGVRPWTKPWDTAHAGISTLPLRANGQAYRGINSIALWAAAEFEGYASPYWMTFKQALARAAFAVMRSILRACIGSSPSCNCLRAADRARRASASDTSG